QVISIARDSITEMTPEVQTLGINSIPVLSDPDLVVSEKYDVLQWAIDNGEPSHTFILVDGEGKITWIKDYGAPDNPNRTMYVEVGELVNYVKSNLGN
ncbi:MAG: peroxiredoxin family protein, partial [Anaerolineales bacterium]|nr:peroxiredoxin family protein [Anaerolineales bacterium]